MAGHMLASLLSQIYCPSSCFTFYQGKRYKMFKWHRQ